MVSYGDDELINQLLSTVALLSWYFLGVFLDVAWLLVLERWHQGG